MEASQQVVYSPPMPLFVLTPRTDGTHFIFDFGTVSNQSYTVWFNSRSGDHELGQLDELYQRWLRAGNHRPTCQWCSKLFPA